MLQEECRKIVSPLIAAMQAFSVVALLLGLTLSGKAAKDKKATRRATISRGTRSMFNKRHLIGDIVYNFGKFKRH